MESCISPGVLVASSIWRASQSRPESLRSHAKPTVTVMATTASRPARPSSPHVAICFARRILECLYEADVELENIVDAIARVERERHNQPQRTEAGEEIGRVSGRARVGHDVEVSVAAVSLKKKTVIEYIVEVR